MLVIMKPDSMQEDKERVVELIHTHGFDAHLLPGKNRYAIGITGNKSSIEKQEFQLLPGVQECISVTKPYKLVSKDFKDDDSVIEIAGKVKIGGGHKVLISGPCAVESSEQLLRIAKLVQSSGATILRAGAFKPRTSPYSFQGLGLDGLKILKEVSMETGLPTVTEAIDLDSLESVCEFGDMIQVGARNMQNFTLLQEIGKCKKPVLLKRGPSATMEEILCSAEYIFQNGNPNVVLCERGLRGFDSQTRNLLDISFVPVMKKLTHLPILVDPSHAAGRRDIIPALAKASMAVGADGVMIEVHDRPEEALSDGPQALLPETFSELVCDLKSRQLFCESAS